MIRVSHLKKTFGPTVAVDDISFEVHEGEVCGFLGPNGAGKSTTMRMLTTYLDPDEGEIEIAGFDVLSQPLEARRRLGYLPESAPLYEEMGVVETLNYAARIRGLDRGTRRTRVGEMIDTCGLEDVVRKDVGELSKGYRQRLGLAQTLLHDPQFLILDEPTTGLDPNQIREVREVIKRIGETRTILLSTHILPEVQATCSRALIINQGSIVADGHPDQLVAESSRAAGARFQVVLRCPDAAAALRAVNELEVVESAEERDRDGDWLRMDVRGQVADLGEPLFLLAVKEKWVLRELRPEHATLEDVFGRLTLGTDDAAGPTAGPTDGGRA